MSDFLFGLTGDIVTPFDLGYREDRQGYNRAIQQFPLIIVYCRNKRDISNAILWSRRHDIAIRIRNGGHNYEGYSNGNCTLIIDVSKLIHMKIDECTNQLYVEGGVTNGLVYDYVSSKGYPFPGGTCPTVGVGGYSLGGGWGLSCRNFGLGCDSLIDIELINYEGVLIKANKELNPELFWACQGAGGGNFGVIASMTFWLPPKVDMVTLIEIDYLHVNQEEQKVFLSTWQNWLKNADKRITLISRIYNSLEDQLSMLVRGIFYGGYEEVEYIMADFLALEGARYNIETMSFLEAVSIIGSVYPPYEKFQSVSRFVEREFHCDEISELVGLIQEPPKGSVFTGLSMYALGGRVSEINKDDTAFFYRQANYIIWLETVWEENKYAIGNRLWIYDQYPYLESVTMGSYVNFPYNGLPNYLEEYYGCHVQKLLQIKAKYDPYNIFSFPQGIQRTEDGCYIDNPMLPRAENNFDGYKPSQHLNYRGFRYVTKDSEV